MSVIQELYSIQNIIGGKIIHNIDRIPRDKETRGKRKLELLDIFSCIVNGDNICTASFLDIGKKVIYISVNESDDLDSTIRFANELFSRMKSLVEEFDVKESDNLLLTILIRNINRIQSHITRSKSFKKNKKYLDDMGITTSMFDNKKKLDNSNVFEYVRESDQLYDRMKQQKNCSERDRILSFLRNISYLRWYYIKLMKCMCRFHKPKIDTFSSITKIEGVPCIKGFNPMNIKYIPDSFISDLYEDNIINNLDTTNKICSYMNTKVDDKIINIDELPILGDREIKYEFNGSIHAEISLVCFLLSNSITHGEIGTSKLCCTPCCMFLEMLTRRNLAEFNKSGSHGKSYTSWIFPIIENRFKDDFNLIAKDITVLLFISYMMQIVS